MVEGGEPGEEVLGCRVSAIEQAVALTRTVLEGDWRAREGSKADLTWCP